MPEFYRRDRGYPFTDYLTAAEAARLLKAAEADEHAELRGSSEDPDGFSYWSGWHETAGALIRVRVRPVAREHVPPEDLARLEAQEDASGTGAVGRGRESSHCPDDG